MKPTRLKSKPTKKCDRCARRGLTLCGCKSQPQRKTRINPVGARKKRQQADPEVYGDHHDFIRTLPCMLAADPRHTCEGGIDGHHIKHTGNGGKDRDNEVPLCRAAHTGQGKSVHVMGQDSFDAYWRLDSRARAKRYTRMYDEREVA